MHSKKLIHNTKRLTCHTTKETEGLYLNHKTIDHVKITNFLRVLINEKLSCVAHILSKAHQYYINLESLSINLV